MRSILSVAVVGVVALGCSGRYEVGAMDGLGGSAGKSAAMAMMDAGQQAGESGGASSNNAGRPPATGGSTSATYAGMTGAGGVRPSAGGSSTAGSSTAGSTTTGSTGPSVCDGRTVPHEAYIDNFETDAHFIDWYAFSDTTPPNMPLPGRVMFGALGTMYAGHMYATGIKSSKMMGYGAGFGSALVEPFQGYCADLSAFTGISFWLKGSAGADNSLRFQIVSALTQPADSVPSGDCPSSASPCAYKHPYKTIMLTADWTHVVINFADLVPSSAFAANKVMGFNLITDGPDYEAFIDEVTFFKNTAPIGPVGP